MPNEGENGKKIQFKETFYLSEIRNHIGQVKFRRSIELRAAATDMQRLTGVVHHEDGFWLGGPKIKVAHLLSDVSGMKIEAGLLLK